MGAGDVVEVAADASRTYEKVRDRLFGYALVAATVAGIVALIVLMLYVLWDALELHTGDPVWYLTYAVALGAPLAGVALYGRRNPDARAAGLRFAGVAVAGLAVGLTAYGVLFALDPRDVLVYAAVGLVPALGVALYGRRKGRDVDHLIQARPLLEDPDLLRKMPIYYFYRSQIVYDPELIHEEMTDESQIEGFRRDIARILTWLAGTPERRRAQLQLVRVLEELDGAHQLAEHERLGQLDAWRLSAGP